MRAHAPALFLALCACGPGTAIGGGDAEGDASSGTAESSTAVSSITTSSNSDAGSDDGTPPCVPGQAIECACTDGSTGSQVCEAHGQSFGPCVCDDPGTGSSSGTPGTSTAAESTGGPADCLPEDDPLIGNLVIESADDIAAFEGHSVIAGQLQIIGSGVLTLEGLECIRVVGSNAYIGETTLLADLTGLDNLETVQGDLQIGPNNGLQSTAGLSSVTSVNWLNIHDNPDLADLGGLSSLTSVSAGLSINGNWSLPTCDAFALVDQLDAPPPMMCVQSNLADACLDQCG